jgi:hypothetical protein
MFLVKKAVRVGMWALNRCPFDGRCTRDGCPRAHPRGVAFDPCPEQQLCKNPRCRYSHCHRRQCPEDCDNPNCKYLHARRKKHSSKPSLGDSFTEEN